MEHVCIDLTFPSNMIPQQNVNVVVLAVFRLIFKTFIYLEINDQSAN